MPTVVVLGARGVVGRAVAQLLHAAGHTLVGVVRPRAGANDQPAGAEGPGPRSVDTPDLDVWDAGPDGGGAVYATLRAVDLDDPAQCAAAFSDADLVVNALGPMGETGRLAAQTAAAVGVSLVDVGTEQALLNDIVIRLHTRATDRGVTIVPGAGLQHLVGESLAVLAAEAIDEAAEVHVAYTLPGRGTGLRAATTGRRRSLAAGLGAPARALVDGVLVDEMVAAERRLAWFPRPVGPAHAAAMAGGEAITLPRSLPQVRLVRTYLALAGWRAELVQATAHAAQVPTLRRWLVRRMQRPRPTPSSVARKAVRWACVAEVRSPAGDLARAWAYGHDPAQTTAASAAHVALRLLSGEVPAGVLGPAQVDAPAELLHAVAEASDLRWARS